MGIFELHSNIDLTEFDYILGFKKNDTWPEILRDAFENFLEYRIGGVLKAPVAVFIGENKVVVSAREDVDQELLIHLCTEIQGLIDIDVSALDILAHFFSGETDKWDTFGDYAVKEVDDE